MIKEKGKYKSPEIKVKKVKFQFFLPQFDEDLNKSSLLADCCTWTCDSCYSCHDPACID